MKGDRSSQKISRRSALGLGAAAMASMTLGRAAGEAMATTGDPALASSAVDLLRPDIWPRDAWGVDHLVAGPIEPEDDVRFLLVHHTASTNDYGPDEVADQIRGFHRFHTGPEKGWPDVAYNFFVDRFGGMWEARTGSLAGPVRGDATGGSQGHALLCSLIGDHSQVPVSAEARTSLVSLLAWLAERHGIATAPGNTVDFVSRGSNRWPAGATVTAATISGHRDMSQTTCPGDLAYAMITADLPREVTELRLGAAAAVAATTTTVAPPTTAPTTATSTTSTQSTVETQPPEVAAPVPAGDDGGLVGGSDIAVPAAIAGAAAAVIGGAALAAGRRTAQRESGRDS